MLRKVYIVRYIYRIPLYVYTAAKYLFIHGDFTALLSKVAMRA